MPPVDCDGIMCLSCAPDGCTVPDVISELEDKDHADHSATDSSDL